MKATGIVRRIDELGRVVIPKEIRKNLHIREGENVEIYVDPQENIILKKFSTMKRLNDLAQNFTDVIHSFFNHNIIITDQDHIIAASGNLKKQCINKLISDRLTIILQKRENIIEKDIKKIELNKGKILEGRYIINCILVHGDVVGLVILFSTDYELSETDEKLTNIVSNLFSKYLEE